MPADAPQDQLAGIAAVTDRLDGVLDELFAAAAELKAILARTKPGEKEGERDQHTRPG